MHQRHCMECGHDFYESVWDDGAYPPIDPSTCPICGSDETLVAARP